MPSPADHTAHDHPPHTPPKIPSIPANIPADNPADNPADPHDKEFTYDLAPQGEGARDDHHRCPIGPGATDDDLPPGFASVVPLRTTHPGTPAVPDPLADHTPDASALTDRRRAAAEAEHAHAWRRAWWVLALAWTGAILTTPLHSDGDITAKLWPMAAYLACWIAGGVLGYLLLAFTFFKPDDGFFIDLVRTMGVAAMGAATHSVLISTQTYLMDVLIPPTAMFMGLLWLRRAEPFEAVCLSGTVYLISVLTFLVASGRLDGG